MDSSNIIWSENATLLKFQNDLPKVVFVEEGHYSDNDDTTVSTGEVLTLHCTKKLRSYKAVNRLGQEIYIPTSIEAKIETVPSTDTRVFETVQELVENGVERVQWLYATPWLKIEEGDVLQIMHEILDYHGTKSVRMSFVDKQLDNITVPFDYCSKFKEISKKTLWLGRGKEGQFSYPVTIKIMDDSLKLSDEEKTSDLSKLSDLGEITLQGVQETEVFIASIQDMDNRIVVMKIPTSLDITVRGGVGMLGGENDTYTYANVCTRFNKRARLENLKEDIYDCVRIGGINTTVERIYDVAIDNDGECCSDDDDTASDYLEVGPQVPPRGDRPPLRPPQPSSSEDEQSDYEEYDIEEHDNTQQQSDVTNRERVIHREDRIQHPQIIDPVSQEIESKNSYCCFCFRNTYSQSNETSSFTVPPVPIRPSYCASTIQTVHAPNAAPLSRYVDDRVIRGEPLPEQNHGIHIPENLRGLSIEDVSECLQMLNMPQHIENFKQNQIDGQLFADLDEKMLVDLGVLKQFEKRKLIKFINGWRPQLEPR